MWGANHFFIGLNQKSASSTDKFHRRWSVVPYFSASEFSNPSGFPIEWVVQCTSAALFASSHSFLVTPYRLDNSENSLSSLNQMMKVRIVAGIAGRAKGRRSIEVSGQEVVLYWFRSRDMEAESPDGSLDAASYCSEAMRLLLAMTMAAPAPVMDTAATRPEERGSENGKPLEDVPVDAP
jgi:hypothetical protein